MLFAPDGRLAVVSRTGVIRLIDVATGAELQRLEGRPEVVGESASFSQDGSVLVTVGSSGFVGWDVDGAETLSPVHDRDRGRRMSVYAEFIDAVLCPTVTGPVIAYDLESGNEFRQFDAPPAEDCAIVVSPEGTKFVKVTSCAEGAARPWSGASMVPGRSAISPTARRHRTTSSSTASGVTLRRSSSDRNRRG